MLEHYGVKSVLYKIKELLMKLGKQLFRQTVLANALTIAFAAGVSTVAVVPSAFAQSNTTGNISGKVDAKAGTTIVVTGVDNGVKRNAAVEANGTYRLTSLPIGNYRVQLMNGGAVVGTREVEVRIAQDSDASFGAGGVQTVEVTGRRRQIDVKASNSGSSFTSKELQALPLAPAIANVVQLAGGTTRGDYRYGNNAASFGGSSASENAAYVNGFPITNSLYQVGYSALPFNSIAEAQIITGGYGAEFGRSTGGVVNITTKSGSNRWEMGIGATYAPDRLRATPKNIMYPNTGKYPTTSSTGTDGLIYNYKAGDVETQRVYNGYISGPIIKDKLFFYFAAEKIETDRETARLARSSTTNATAGWLESDSRVPRSLTKIDWNITDEHHLEYTRFTDKSEVEDRYYGFNYTTLQRGFTQNGGASFVNYASGLLGLTATGAALQAPQGANVDILKYTGYLTDNLTVQLLGGRAKTARQQIPFGYVPGQHPVTAIASNRVPEIAGNYVATRPQNFTSALLRDDAHDKNEGYRLDIEYKWNQHTIRGGLDYNKITAANGTTAAGGGTYNYLFTNTPTVPLAGNNISPAAGGGFGPRGYYVTEVITSGGSTPSVEQSAQYIEDRYQLNKDLLLTFGLRNESFTNMNGQGTTFVEQKNMLAPRLAFAWDVRGDASLKLFGTLGRYFMQLPANMAVRFAGGSLNTTQFFTYTGVDPLTGAPTGMKALSGLISPNSEFGLDPDPQGLAATNLKPHYQDEINLGFETAVTRNYNGGVKFTYRTLRNTIDDVSDVRPILKKLTAAEGAYLNENGWHGALFNPGSSNDFLVPISATAYKKVTITPQEFGFTEKPKRKYLALEFMLEHPMRDSWYGKVNYTWSKNWGNQEGQTKSDNAQADVSFTSGWDFAETMLNASGLLPNNRTHQLKAYGLYQLTPEWNVGGNALVASGRPKSATCNIPQFMDNEGVGLSGYGSIYFLCPGEGATRGGRGTLPTDVRFDMNVIYKPRIVEGLAFKVDVLNVFNRQTAQAIDEAQNQRDAGTLISPTASQILSYTQPRSVRFTVQYDKKF
jgi:hypothetical protein